MQIIEPMNRNLKKLARKWAAPVEKQMMRLITVANTPGITDGALRREIEQTLATLPKLMDEMNPLDIADDLEIAIGEVVIAGIEGKKP